MPSHVSNYLWLSIMGLAIGLVGAYFNFDEAALKAARIGGGNFVLILDVIAFAISIGLISAVVWGRQNWARWVQMVFYLLGLAAMAIGIRKMLEMGSFQMGITLIQTAIQGVALFFIFTGDAKDWFKRDSRA